MLGKTINSLAQEQSASVTVRIQWETEGCDISCDDATTVWNDPVAKNCSAAANWVDGAIGCDRIVDRLKKVKTFLQEGRTYIT